MHATCLHCTRSLGGNEVLEALPVGRRIAFDAAQGRLWVVCRHCAKWNLVPFDTRLETIDAAERLFRDTRTRFSTDNIGLARLPEGLELVRIGSALRPEFAAWRYGESYRRRRRKALIAGSAGVAMVGAAMVGMGTAGVALGTFGYMGYKALEYGWKVGIERAAKVLVPDPRTSRPMRLGTEEFRQSLIAWESDRPSLDVPLLSLLELPQPKQRYITASGTEFQTTGRKIVGGFNVLAGRKTDLAYATDLLATNGGDLEPWLRQQTEWAARLGGPNHSWRFPGTPASRLLPRYTRPYLPLQLLTLSQRLAVEMWMNEDIERTWLEGELKLLEREWREADRLAKIADELALEGNATDGATVDREA